MLDNMGITEAYSEVMAQERGAVMATDVVNLLESVGFDIKSQQNANASVHSVLSRLARKSQISRGNNENGATWKGPMFDPDYDNIPF